MHFDCLLKEASYDQKMAKIILRLLTALWALSIARGAIVRGYRLGAILETIVLAHLAKHLGVFAVLGILLMFSFDTPSLRLLGIWLGIAFGLNTELYEHLAFHGHIEYGDVLIDALGVLAGPAAAPLLKRTGNA